MTFPFSQKSYVLRQRTDNKHDVDQDLAAFVEAWKVRWGADHVTCGDLVKLSVSLGLFQRVIRKGTLAARATRFGVLLANLVGKGAAGLVIHHAAPTSKSRSMWRLENVAAE